jgi:prepilin signal peptidase PulO-like enzyme (type II secretory pathway)
MGFIPFHDSFVQQIYGVLIGAGIMLLSALLGRLIFRKETLGFGDVKLFAAIGLALGVQGTLFVLAASALTSAAVFGIGLIRKRIKRDDMVPLGPYICGAGIFYVAIIWPLL